MFSYDQAVLLLALGSSFQELIIVALVLLILGTPVILVVIGLTVLNYYLRKNAAKKSPGNRQPNLIGQTSTTISATTPDLVGRTSQQSVHSKLQPCPDCGHQVSRLARHCPKCGRPLAAGTSN